MKNLFFFLLTTFSVTNCFGQYKYEAGKYIVEGKTFIVQTVNYGKPKMGIRLETEHEFKGYKAPKKDAVPVYIKHIHVDTTKGKNLILDVLKAKTTGLKANKESIRIAIVFAQNGNIETISYSVKGNTHITLQEIAKIDKKLKSNIKATFTGPDYMNHYFITYHQLGVVF